MDKKLKFIFFNVGQGDATLIEFPTGEFMLIDNKNGGKINVREYLKDILPKKNDKPFLNYFLLTHAHIDHVGSVNELFGEFEIGEVWYTGFEFKKTEQEKLPDQYKQFLDEIEKRKKKYSDWDIAVSSKTILEKSVGEVKFEFMAPPSREEWEILKKKPEVASYLKELEEAAKKSKDKNLSDLIHVGSVVGRITYMGSAVLITGDSELLSWKFWIIPNFSKYCPARLLHASHHGSKGFFISNADSDKEEPFNEKTEGCFTGGLLAISPQIVVITNNTKPGQKDHQSPPNKYAIALYEKFKDTKRDVLFTSDGSIKYVIPDNAISDPKIDEEKKYQNSDSEKSRILYERPVRASTGFTSKYGN